MPEDIRAVKYNATTNKLYLFGEQTWWTFDLTSKELRGVFEINGLIMPDIDGSVAVSEFNEKTKEHEEAINEQGELKVDTCLGVADRVSKCYVIFNLETGQKREVIDE
jgi:hypothetical protein